MIYKFLFWTVIQHTDPELAHEATLTLLEMLPMLRFAYILGLMVAT